MEKQINGIGRRKAAVTRVFLSKGDGNITINEKDYKQLIPLNRFGTAEEVADAVDFLASDRSTYITGQTLSINGGLHS